MHTLLWIAYHLLGKGVLYEKRQDKKSTIFVFVIIFINGSDITYWLHPQSVTTLFCFNEDKMTQKNLCRFVHSSTNVSDFCVSKIRIKMLFFVF